MVGLENFELLGIKTYTRFWGLLMFGSYSVINVIVLLNLLIAMVRANYLSNAPIKVISSHRCPTRMRWLNNIQTPSGNLLEQNCGCLTLMNQLHFHLPSTSFLMWNISQNAFVKRPRRASSESRQLWVNKKIIKRLEKRKLWAEKLFP